MWNARMPFVSFRDRPVSIAEGSREVRLSYKTGFSLSTRDQQDENNQVTMTDLMTETTYLNPDVVLFTENNTPATSESYAEVLTNGHKMIGQSSPGIRGELPSDSQQ